MREVPKTAETVLTSKNFRDKINGEFCKKGDVEMNFFEELANYDAEVSNACSEELARQQRNIELIASENIVSKAVLLAAGPYFFRDEETISLYCYDAPPDWLSGDT